MRLKTTLVLITGLLALTALAAGADEGGPSEGDADATVHVGHNSLEPAEVTIAAGGTVTFINEDRMPGGHTLVADDGAFASDGLGEGESFSHTFEEPGTYTYHIAEHPEATGTIIVE